MAKLYAYGKTNRRAVNPDFSSTGCADRLEFETQQPPSTPQQIAMYDIIADSVQLFACCCLLTLLLCRTMLLPLVLQVTLCQRPW
jgi:hypothetical protein